MKITFPHIGDAHLLGRIFFAEIGIDVVTPPTNTAKGLESGSGISPDEICIPFKLMADNLAEAYKHGADTVVMPATMGPCRLGEYGELLKSVLDRRGYAYRWILLDSANAIGKKELLRRLTEVVSDSEKSKTEILRALYGTYQLIKNLELLDRRAHLLAGYEAVKGSLKKETADCRRKLACAGSIEEALEIIRGSMKHLEKIPLDKTKQPLHLLVTGEIYSMIEPFANHHIEDLLMDMSISFEKRVTLGWWIRHTLIDPFLLRTLVPRKNKYLPYAIGGYAKETVEDGLQCSKKSFDGVIQIFPVGCMPEIVAKAVFAKMTKEKKISVLTLIYDEMAGEAGYITRIEAFADMLERKKRAAASKGGYSAQVSSTEATERRESNVLSGH